MNITIGKVTYPVIGGYDRDGKNILMVDDEDIPLLYRIEGDTAYWSGGLQGSAQERFDVTKEGDFFTYNKKKFRRLTSSEIETILASTPKFRFAVD